MGFLKTIIASDAQCVRRMVFTLCELGKMMIRTPLGGFVNHSDTPNCVKVKSLLTRQQWNNLIDLPNDKYDHNFTKWDLVTLRDIDAGDELTVRYTFYKI